MPEGVYLFINYSENRIMTQKFSLLDIDYFSNFLKTISLMKICVKTPYKYDFNVLKHHDSLPSPVHYFGNLVLMQLLPINLAYNCVI